MTLGAPMLLWGLAVLPLLWWLSLPSRPRQETWTPHLAQWRLALGALRRRPPRFARLRFLLLALAAAAAALAAAQPVLPGEPGPTRLVVLLDTSASMAAVDTNGAAAAARARQALTAAFAALPPHVDVTLLATGGGLVRRHGASARALHDVAAPAGALDLDLDAVAAAAAASPHTVVWTLTDGQGQEQMPAAGALTTCVAAGPNAAITGLRIEDRWPLPGLSLSIDVIAFTAAACRGELRVAGAITDLAPRELELVPGSASTLDVEAVRTAAGGELRAELVIDGDVLRADDAWSVQLPPLPAPRIAVLVDGEAGPYANVAAKALAEEVGGSVVAPAAGSEVGLLLVDGGRVELTAGHTRALTFGCQLGGGGELRAWQRPLVADWDRQSPLTVGLDLSELVVSQAWRGVLPAGEPFLWAEDGGAREPLAVVAGGEQLASVHFAFRLQDSNLPLLPAFPQLLRRAFVRAYGAGAAPVVRSLPPAAGEQDLLHPATGPDRPLPPFGTADTELAPWLLLAGLIALAARSFVR